MENIQFNEADFKIILSIMEDPDKDPQLGKFFSEGGTLGLLKNIDAEQLEAVYAMAKNLYEVKKYSKAKEYFELLCCYNHFDYRYWYALGNSRMALKEYSSAIDAFSYVALIEKEFPLAALQAASCYMHLKDMSRALAALEDVIKKCKGNDIFQQEYLKAADLINLVEKYLDAQEDENEHEHKLEEIVRA